MTDVKLWMLYSYTRNHLIVCKNSSGLFKNVINKMCLEIIYSIYMYDNDLNLYNLQYTIKPNQA